MREILPRATIVTPNLPEAEVLAGTAVRSESDAWEACRRILELGPEAVLLKGGHGEGEWVEDRLAGPNGLRETFRSKRVATRNTHGTGCTLSAAIAAHLGHGEPLAEAVAKARALLQAAVRESYDLGAGHGPTNPYAAVRFGGHNAVLERLREAWEILEEGNPSGLIPEVQSNLAEALPGQSASATSPRFPGGSCAAATACAAWTGLASARAGTWRRSSWRRRGGGVRSARS